MLHIEVYQKCVKRENGFSSLILYCHVLFLLLILRMLTSLYKFV